MRDRPARPRLVRWDSSPISSISCCPAGCAGCGAPGRLLCPACTAVLIEAPGPARPTPAPPGLPACLTGGRVRRSAARAGARLQGARPARSRRCRWATRWPRWSRAGWPAGCRPGGPGAGAVHRGRDPVPLRRPHAGAGPAGGGDAARATGGRVESPDRCGPGRRRTRPTSTGGPGPTAARQAFAPRPGWPRLTRCGGAGRRGARVVCARRRAHHRRRRWPPWPASWPRLGVPVAFAATPRPPPDCGRTLIAGLWVLPLGVTGPRGRVTVDCHGQ